MLYNIDIYQTIMQLSNTTIKKIKANKNDK